MMTFYAGFHPRALRRKDTNHFWTFAAVTNGEHPIVYTFEHPSLALFKSKFCRHAYLGWRSKHSFHAMPHSSKSTAARAHKYLIKLQLQIFPLPPLISLFHFFFYSHYFYLIFEECCMKSAFKSVQNIWKGIYLFFFFELFIFKRHKKYS